MWKLLVFRQVASFRSTKVSGWLNSWESELKVCMMSLLAFIGWRRNVSLNLCSRKWIISWPLVQFHEVCNEIWINNWQWVSFLNSNRQDAFDCGTNWIKGFNKFSCHFPYYHNNNNNNYYYHYYYHYDYQLPPLPV